MDKDVRDCILANYGRLKLGEIGGILRRVYGVEMSDSEIARVAYGAGLSGAVAPPEDKPYVKGQSVRRQRKSILKEIEARKLEAKRRIGRSTDEERGS